MFYKDYLYHYHSIQMQNLAQFHPADLWQNQKSLRHHSMLYALVSKLSRRTPGFGSSKAECESKLCAWFLFLFQCGLRGADLKTPI